MRSDASARGDSVGGDVPVETRGEASARIGEVGFTNRRSTLYRGDPCGSAVGVQDSNGVFCVQDTLRSFNATTVRGADPPYTSTTEHSFPERPHGGKSLVSQERRSDDARNTPVREGRGVHEEMGVVQVRGQDRHTRRDVEEIGSSLMPRDTYLDSTPPEVASTLEEGRAIRCGNANNGGDSKNPRVHHLAQTQTKMHMASKDGRGGYGATSWSTPTAASRHRSFCEYGCFAAGSKVSCEQGGEDVDSLPEDGSMRGHREAACLPRPRRLSNGSSSASNSPQRHQGPSAQRVERIRSSSLNCRSMTFIERQEHEQLATELRRKEIVKAEEDARRRLASRGPHLSRASRVILARSSFANWGTDDRGQEPSVFERLARSTSNHLNEDSYGPNGADNEGGTFEASIGGTEYDCFGRHPFTPRINPRSSKLALRMPHREGGGRDCLQERLYRDGEEQLRRRERKSQLLDRALREKAVSRHVNSGSKRVLARKSRSKVLRFLLRMTAVLEVVDPERTGWVSFSDLERVLSECEMLPGQPTQEAYENVLLAVWEALSAEIPCGDRDDGEPRCGVPTDILYALLNRVVSDKHECRWTNSNGHNDSACSEASLPVNRRKPLQERPAKHQFWTGGKEQLEQWDTEFDAFATLLQRDEQLRGICKGLSDIFLANQRPGDGRIETKGKTQEGNRTSASLESQGPTGAGFERGKKGVPTNVVTPAQVAAMSERFAERLRAKDRKIEHLRQAEVTRMKLAHPFKPDMATTAASRASVMRPNTAEQVSERDGGALKEDCGSQRSVNGAVAEGRQQTRRDRRTTEEREMDEQCTFQPRLFQPLPLPQPRYPVRKALHSRWGGGSTGDPTNPTAEKPPSTTVDRAIASWDAQVYRLKAGRKKRLCLLKQKQTIENRAEPFPLSVQELFIDAGIEMHSHESGENTSTVGAGAGVRTRNSGSRCIATKKEGRQQQTSVTQRLSSSPRCRLEARLHARSLLKEKKIEEEARKHAEEDARRQKRKRVLERACKRSAAVAGLKAALSAREAEQGVLSWTEPPALIAEVEFVRQKRWVLLPLWADSCPREAVCKLIKHQEALTGTVAQELEISFREELQHACEQNLGRGVGRGQDAGNGASGRGIVGRGGKSRRAVPTVVLQVDTAVGDPPHDTKAKYSSD